MSAASSGAVFSSAMRTPSTIWPTGSDSASAIWPGDLDFLGHAVDQVAALDVDRLADAVGGRLGDADFLLDPLGGGFADQQIVVAADIRDDRFVHLVAADAHLVV
jgi:hypothetical protein